MSAFLRDNRAIVALIVLYLVLGGIYSSVTPIFEAGDEIWHYPFVQFLATGHGLPVQDPARRDVWAQEGGQPPLYYGLSAGATFWIDTSDLSDRLWRNPYAKIGIPLAFGNKNLIVHTGAEDWPWHNTTLAVHLIRFLSLLFGAGTVLLTYFLALEITRLSPPRGNTPGTSAPLPSSTDLANTTPGSTEGWRLAVPLFAAAFVAFNPMFLFISASVNNDSLAVVLASLSLLLTVQLVTRGLDKRRTLLLGIICGLGALSKVSDLGLLPLALAVAAWVSWSASKQTAILAGIKLAARQLLVPAALITLPALIIAGWWYGRNYVLYSDPLAFNVWVRIAGGRAAPMTILGLLDEFQGFRISFWGNFGGVNLIAGDWVYLCLDLITIAALVGLAIGAIRRRLPTTLLIPGIWLGIVLAGLVRWTWLTYASQGRLVFPAISAVGVVLAFGLSCLASALFEAIPRIKARGLGRLSPIWARVPQPFNLFAAGFLLTFAALAPFLIIAPAYQLPPRSPGGSTVPNPVHITYPADDAEPELVGYDIGRSVQPGRELPLTLYWRTAAALDQDLYVYIHLYDASANLVGQWDSFPGNGLYPTRLWQPGDLIVDRYRVPVSYSLVGPQVGRAEVGLARVGSTVPLSAHNPGGDTIVPSIARFKIAAPSSTISQAPDLFEFGGQLGARNLQFSASRGGRIFQIDPTHLTDAHVFGADVMHVAFAMHALKVPDGDYTLFIHVVDGQGKILVQHDEPPGGSSYPTSFWDAGESVDGQFDMPIPNGAPAGEYQVELGLYQSTSGVRLPVHGSSIGSLAAAGDHLVLAPVTIGK